MVESLIALAVVTITTVLLVGTVQSAMETANQRIDDLAEQSVPFPPAVTSCVEETLQRYGVTAEGYLSAYAQDFPRPRDIDYALQSCTYPMVGGDDPTYDPMDASFIDPVTGEWMTRLPVARPEWGTR